MNQAVFIPDVQGSIDTRQIAINKVGIKDLKHPLYVQGRTGESQPTVARVNMSVNLPHYQKGTHMSRFVQLLNEINQPLDFAGFQAWLRGMRERLEAEAGYIDVRFSYFVKKTAPISEVQSLLDYEVSLRGEIHTQQTQVLLTVVVPVTSLCPCSKEISQYGAHNQRSHLTLTTYASPDVWIEDLIEIAEAEASSQLYGLLKRSDEKYVTETAYENPKFVEDVVRDVARHLRADVRITAFRVEAENFESIHNHSAYALIEEGF